MAGDGMKWVHRGSTMSASLQRFDAGQGDVQGGLPVRAALTLAHTIEREIVPRLVVARAPAALVAAAPFAAEVLDLAALAIGPDGAALRAEIADAVARRGFQAVCIDLLAPAARHLGHMWEEDLCSFTDVSVGLQRLHESLRRIDHGTAEGTAEGQRRRRILLAQAPGDQHMFGLSMVASLFSHAGWSVTALFPGNAKEMAALLRREWFGLIGISLGAEVNLQRVAAMLPQLREASRNRAIAIMVGGPLFTAHPDIARQIGADATASDGVQATWQAENLLTTRPGYC